MVALATEEPLTIPEHRVSDVQRTLQHAVARLRSRLVGTLGNVSCEFERGVLVLHGRLHSYYHKQLAQEAVADLENVLQVVNDVEVVYPM